MHIPNADTEADISELPLVNNYSITTGMQLTSI